MANLSGFSPLDALAERSRIRNEIISLRAFKKQAIDLLIDQQINIDHMIKDLIACKCQPVNSTTGAACESLSCNEKMPQHPDLGLEASDSTNLWKNN
jgi:hypothetical protein